MRQSIFILFLILGSSLSSAAEKTVTWPLQRVNIIVNDSYGFNNKFFAYSGKKLFAYSPRGEQTSVREIHEFSITAQRVKCFTLLDVDVIVAWNNSLLKLQILVFDKSEKLVSEDLISYSDQVDDMELRFGQGRRPALLFIKNSKNEYKTSIWFDEREQVIFLQSAPILASTLEWSKLAAYIVTREGTKPVIKVWTKGEVSIYPLPFMPIYTRFIDADEKTYLLAVDSKSTLWSISVSPTGIKEHKILTAKELPYIKQLDLVSLKNGIAMVMISPVNKRIYLVNSPDFNQDNKPLVMNEYSMMDENQVFYGKISGELAWMELNSSGDAYLITRDQALRPITDFTWRIDMKAGYPEIFFSWASEPPKKKFEYRYIFDNKIDSRPLPEYRITENKFNVKLDSEGDYYLHIQAREATSGWESIVYHFPVFWKYRPNLPDIYLSNEITPYVVTGNSVNFIVNNLEPLEYFAEVNTIPVHDPGTLINIGAGQGQINQQLKPGKYYLHLRSRNPRTNSYSPTLHYLFFYQSYATEFTVGTGEYNRDLGKLNVLINEYNNAQSMDDKKKVLRELDVLMKSIEKDISAFEK